jgi:hypothetical protein
MALEPVNAGWNAMPESSSANVIQWADRAHRTEHAGADSAHRVEPIPIYDAAAVFEAEAASKLRFISEQTRKYWQYRRRRELRTALL